MKYVFNERSGGRFKELVGVEVELIDYSWNGMAMHVKMPERPETLHGDDFWPHMKRPWVPTTWLDKVET